MKVNFQRALLNVLVLSKPWNRLHTNQNNPHSLSKGDHSYTE